MISSCTFSLQSCISQLLHVDSVSDEVITRVCVGGVRVGEYGLLFSFGSKEGGQ